MQAVVCSKYGGPEVLELQEVKKPVPKDNEILVKNHVTTVTSADYRIRGAQFPLLFWLPMRLIMGFKGPRNSILGMEFAGQVESVGKNVTKFKTGDQVFGSTYDGGFGGYAEYVCISEEAVITQKSAEMPFEEAATIFFGGHTALHFLRKANIQPGQKILVYGASGCIGTFAVQLAKYFGVDVTGICSTANVELVKSLGADNVIDYTREDFTQNGETYDVIFDTVGFSPFDASVKSLAPKGYYLRAVHLDPGPISKGFWVQLTSKKKVIGGEAGETIEDLEFLKGLVESGKLKPVIDKTFTLEQIVEAHKYVDTGRKRGSVVITIGD